MSFSPEQIKKRLMEILSESNSNEDVYLKLGPNDYGVFIWDEVTYKHIHMKSSELYKTLGERLDLPLVKIAWADLKN